MGFKLTHYQRPMIEIHIGNVHNGSCSGITPCASSGADGMIAGFGTQGRVLALRRPARLIEEEAQQDGAIAEVHRRRRVERQPAGEAGSRGGGRLRRRGDHGVEIMEADLLSFDGSPAHVRRIAESLGLGIDRYQPFRDFEAMPGPARARNLDRAERKVDLMQALGAETHAGMQQHAACRAR